MLMRYHFGLGVGHLYACRTASENTVDSDSDSQQHSDDEVGPSVPGESVEREPAKELDGSLDIEELNSDLDSGDDSLDLGSNGERSENDVTDDEEFYALEQMYRM